MKYDFDLAVIGGGSGGYGAALAAARRGLSVLLVEAAPSLGGTSTLGGVNTWEPGICGPGFSAELFRNLSAQPDAIGLSHTTKFCTHGQPWALSQINPALRYEQSLRRSGLSDREWVRVTFEPVCMAREMEKLLRDAGVHIAFATRFIGAETAAEWVTSIAFSSSRGEWRVRPRFVIDSTAGLHVGRAIGCATRLGDESYEIHHEPSAPAQPAERVNGVSLCFRVQRAASRRVEPLPPGVEPSPLPAVINMTEYPNGDVNMNPLPVMEGAEYLQRCERDGIAATRTECEHRVLRTWYWLQTERGFDNWRLKYLAPMTGVREGARLLGRRVLTELDIRAGWEVQADAERAIALADHALDVHGEGHVCRELEAPYGVPYECLLPCEYSNFAVACRAASFSHIAAASCRLSRTMMDLGHAAGLAATLAVQDGTTLPNIDVHRLRAALQEDGVTLEATPARSLAAV